MRNISNQGKHKLRIRKRQGMDFLKTNKILIKRMTDERNMTFKIVDYVYKYRLKSIFGY